MIARTQRQHSLQPRSTSSIKLGKYVRNKDDFFGRELKIGSDAAITAGFDFRADSSIEVTTEERGQIACGGVTEQQLLRQYAARRVDADSFALLTPAFHCGRHVVEDLA